MKQITQIIALIIFLATGTIIANITESSLVFENMYYPDQTNLIPFRCDWVTPDSEFAYSIYIIYESNMFVTAGYKASVIPEPEIIWIIGLLLPHFKRAQ